MNCSSPKQLLQLFNNSSALQCFPSCCNMFPCSCRQGMGCGKKKAFVPWEYIQGNGVRYFRLLPDFCSSKIIIWWVRWFLKESKIEQMCVSASVSIRANCAPLLDFLSFMHLALVFWERSQSVVYSGSIAQVQILVVLFRTLYVRACCFQTHDPKQLLFRCSHLMQTNSCINLY